jgi:hypothetical protein
MKSFAGVPITLLLMTAMSAGCSNSTSTPSGDGGPGPVADSGQSGQDSSTGDSGGPTGDGGGCPGSVPSGVVPTFTAPALGQNVCASTDVTAFVAACGSAGSATNCGAYAQSSASTACGKCLFSSNSTMAPFETATIGGQAVPLVSVGSCILATSGSTGAACATAVDSLSYCITLACVACSTADLTDCSKQGGEAESTVCGSYASGANACVSVVSAAESCAKTPGSDADLTLEANVICGNGGTSGDAGEDSGPSDAGDQ